MREGNKMKITPDRFKERMQELFNNMDMVFLRKVKE